MRKNKEEKGETYTVLHVESARSKYVCVQKLCLANAADARVLYRWV